MRPLPWLVLLALLISLLLISCVGQLALSVVAPQGRWYTGDLMANSEADYFPWDNPGLGALEPAAVAAELTQPAGSPQPVATAPVVVIAAPSQEPTAAASPSPTSSPSPAAVAASAPSARATATRTSAPTTTPIRSPQQPSATPARQSTQASPTTTPIRSADAPTVPAATNTRQPTATRTATATRTQVPPSPTSTRVPPSPTSTSMPTIIPSPTNTPVPVVTVRFTELNIIRRETDGSADIAVNVSVSPPNGIRGQVTVSYEVVTGAQGGTATRDLDYRLNNGSLTIPTGQASASFSVILLPDNIKEDKETVVLRLTGATGATVDPSGEYATLTIIDANDPPIVTFGEMSRTVTESAGRASIPVQLDIASDFTVTVPYTVGGSAGAGDHTLTSGTLTFPPGATRRSLSFNILDDKIAESQEQLTVTLGTPRNATRGTPNVYTLTIDDDDPVDVSINDVARTEGNANSQQYVFTVSLSNPADRDVLVDYATADITATAGSDYTPISGTLRIPAGSTTGPIAVMVSGDTTLEADETFSVDLANLRAPGGPLAMNLVKAQGLGTISNDDSSVVSIDPVVTAREGDSGTTVLSFTVRLSSPVAEDVSVGYQTANITTTGVITATAGDDYTAASGTLFIPAGEISGTIAVSVTGDLVVENDESFAVDLTGASAPGGLDVAISRNRAIGTIENDDTATVSIGDVTLAERGSGTTTPFAFTVSLTRPLDVNLSVTYTVTNGTALAGSDYTLPVTDTLFIPAGDTSATITVDVSGDDIVEPNETFSVSLTGWSGAGTLPVTITKSLGIGTITNDDTAEIVIDDVAAYEGDFGTTPLTFTVSMNKLVDREVRVNYATVGMTATAGVDYTPTIGTLSIPAMSLTGTIVVSLTGDLNIESDETFALNLSNLTAPGLPPGAILPDPPSDLKGIGTILTDDFGLTIDDVTGPEGDSGTSVFTFTVSLSAPSDADVTVNYTTTDGTALDTSDYTPAVGTLTIPAGEITGTLTVDVSGDTTVEANETFTVDLDSASAGPFNVTITDSQGLGTITNDDTAALTIDNVAAYEGNAGTTPFTFTVSLSNPVDREVRVGYAMADITATAGLDYASNSGTLIIPAGNITGTITVNVSGDSISEADKSFAVNLLNLSGAGMLPVTIANSQGRGTILNDDVALTIDDVTALEGDSGTTAFVFTVSLSVPSDGAVSVDYTTADISAQAGSDYAPISGTLTIARGDTSGTIRVEVRGDTTYEDAELFALNLASPANSGKFNLVLADSQGLGTIQNDPGDLPLVGFSAASYSVGEGGGSITLTVRLSAPAPGEIDVNYASADITALAVADYTAVVGTLNFSTGQIEQTINVPISEDIIAEPVDKTFSVTLSLPSGAALGQASTTVAIVDNDTVSPLAQGGFMQTGGPNYYDSGWNYYSYVASEATYARIDIPCVTGVHAVQIDLYDAGINTVSAGDTVFGGANTTTFTLYQMPDGWTYSSGLPGSGVITKTQTYDPNLTAGDWSTFAELTPASCGTYLLRADTDDNDANGWGMRVGWQVAATDPPTAPASDLDSILSGSAIAGNGNEISVGIQQAALRFLPGSNECHTLYEYVRPGQATATFSNFDLDMPALPARVRYYPPSASYDPLANSGGFVGTTSGSSTWNGSSDTSRRGDTFVNPEPGWWRIVTCTLDASIQNQLIQEGQIDQASYVAQPGTPSLDISVTPSAPTVAAGAGVGFTVAYTNTSGGLTAGAAIRPTLSVTLPSDLTFMGCVGASCVQLGNRLTITLDTVAAGESGALTINTTASARASGPTAITLSADYRDVLGNPFVGAAGAAVTIN